jgi:RimJ/RimL family protein N-acetyltransferase
MQPVHVFLKTERLVLRRFTGDDVDLLVELDSDPEVMHFITGGRATPRREVETEILPAYLEYYERCAGYGYWAAVERSTGTFSAGSTSGPGARTILIRLSSGTGCAAPRGARGMRLKVHAR